MQPDVYQAAPFPLTLISMGIRSDLILVQGASAVPPQQHPAGSGSIPLKGILKGNRVALVKPNIATVFPTLSLSKKAISAQRLPEA